ncbi:MAG: rRNA maturation RNase YbeY [Chitinophagaceae bacterium]
MKNKQSPILFHFLIDGFSLTRRTALKQFIEKLFKREGYKVDSVNYIFCSDEYLLSINQTYLKHDTYTDIVTFPLSEPGKPISSDIFISIERVRENAKTFQTIFSKELHRVIFHGALHLCGYKDKTNAQAQEMRAKEEEYLNRYFVPRGTRR